MSEELGNRVSVPSNYLELITDDASSLPESIRNALLTVRRHRFLDGWFHLDFDGRQLAYQHVDFDRNAPSDDHLAEVYSDQSLVTVHDGNFPTSSTSEPPLVANMLHLLDVHPGMRILEIGTGTGYNAALLAEIGGKHARVITIEYQQSVAEQARRFLQEEGYDNVQVVHGDGFNGSQAETPFDRIVATVGCSDISPHWLEQLSTEGAMLIPIQHGFTHPLVHLTSDPADPLSARGRILGRSAFMKIQGALDWGNPWNSGPISAFQEEPAWCRPLPESLQVPATCGHPASAGRHRSFCFYLSLCSRDLWYDNTGYGLADPTSESIVRLTKQGIEGLGTGQENSDALEQLYQQFLSLHQTWTDLGSPDPSDYSLTFSPVNRHAPSAPEPSIEWHIKRPHFLETIRLA